MFPGGTAIPSPISSDKKSRGSKKRSREKDKLPKLTVLEANESTNVVECQLESKSKTVTFKFDITDVNPEEIASNLVRKTTLIHRDFFLRDLSHHSYLHTVSCVARINSRIPPIDNEH
jgi:hypothetical protein